MKYPEKQFLVLEETIKQLSNYCEVSNINKHTLHFMVYQQLTKDGQDHNKLWCIPGGKLKLFGNMTESDKMGAEKLIQIDFDFKLYPEGCNDNHIETAMKQIFKNLGI